MNTRAIKITGTISCLILILFSYQHCGKVTEKQIAGISALTAPPTSVSILSATNEACSDGGVTLQTYVDNNLNGKLDENEATISTQNICNGSIGAAGAAGSGAGIAVTAASSGSCTAGGIVVTTFVDSNNNGVFDTQEVKTSTSSICNGVIGSDGKSSELTTTRATSAQCAKGGVVYTSTLGGANQQSNIICNGVDGRSSTITQDPASSSQCPTGGKVFTVKNEGSDAVYSVICNGIAGEKGSAGTSSYITTSIANPFQCKNGGVVISTWSDAINPQTQVICNGETGATGASPTIGTSNASTRQCSNGGVVISTSNPGLLPVENVICNGAVGEAGSSGPGYITGAVGPSIPKTNLSACHHDFLYLPPNEDEMTGWLIFRHQKNGTEDQGVGTTGFNVWNVDITSFALASETGSVTYCKMTYNPKERTLEYEVVDKTSGMAGKTGVIKMRL